MSGSVLERIVAETRAVVAQRSAERPLDGDLRAERPGAFAAALRAPGLSVIAEHKRRSPSGGAIREDASIEDIVTAYAAGGARALSILTEERNFGGSLDDLRAARAAVDLPLLRKDFVVDAYQLDEAVAAGADAVLLIVAALTPADLESLQTRATQLGLDVLVEVHDRDELDVALATGAQLIGVNNRDLRDFSVDPARTLELLPAVPDGVAVVSESGLGDPARLAELDAAGVAAVLIGEALMRAPDPAAELRRLLR